MYAVFVKLLNMSIAAGILALLACALRRKMITACPVAFGETNVKGRVKHVLNYKKPAICLVALSVLVCVVVAVCFLTNPKQRTTVPDDSQGDGVYANESKENEEPFVVNIYEETDPNLVDEYWDNDKLVTQVKYYEMSDGTWKTDEYTYQYRLEITGRMGGNKINDKEYFVPQTPIILSSPVSPCQIPCFHVLWEK